MQQFQIPPGGTILTVRGTYLRVESVIGAGTGQEGVVIVAGTTNLGSFLPGEAVTLPKAEEVWRITPNSPAARVVVRIGFGRIDSDRVSGAINIDDSPGILVELGTQFFGWSSKLPLVGNFAIAGIRAADAQTVPTWVNRISILCSVTGGITLSTCTADPGADFAGSGPGAGANKNVGLGTSQTRRIIGSATTATPSAFELPGRATFAFFAVQANTWLQLPIDRPIKLDPGRGIVAVPNVADCTVSLLFDFQERFLT